MGSRSRKDRRRVWDPTDTGRTETERKVRTRGPRPRGEIVGTQGTDRRKPSKGHKDGLKGVRGVESSPRVVVNVEDESQDPPKGTP